MFSTVFRSLTGKAGMVLALCACSTTHSPANEADRLRPPIIPAWAFGHWVWEDASNNSDAVQYLVSGYRSHGIPVDAVIFDSPWSTAYNDFTWDPARYPRPQAMIDDLHARGIRTLVFYTGAINRESTDTPVQQCELYDEVLSRGFSINEGRESRWWKGPALHLDFTHAAAVEWWKSKVSVLHSYGIDGAKIDAAHALFGETVKTARGELGNREFGFHYFKAAFDYHTQQNPEWVAMTYAWSGMGLVGWPATSHVNWVGDFGGDWSGMRDQLTMIYRSAQEGFSGLACEVGGYWGTPSNAKQFIRYAQMSCFMPIMINGGAAGALNHHLPWRHDEETLEIYRKYVQIHRDLAPYLFSTGVDAHLERTTIVREISSDASSHHLGPWLYVQPITSDCDTVHVRLPEGGTWIHLGTGKRHTAGERFEETYPKDQYPVFIRAGAILPVAGCSPLFCDDSRAKEMVVIFPDGVSEYVYHRPIGTGTGYRDVHIRVDSADGTVHVRSLNQDVLRMCISWPHAPARVEGASSWSYDAGRGFVIAEGSGPEFKMRIVENKPSSGSAGE